MILLRDKYDNLKRDLTSKTLELDQINRMTEIKILEAEHFHREFILKLQQELASAKFRISTNESEITEKHSLINRLQEEVLHLRIHSYSGETAIKHSTLSLGDSNVKSNE